MCSLFIEYLVQAWICVDNAPLTSKLNREVQTEVHTVVALHDTQVQMIVFKIEK